MSTLEAIAVALALGAVVAGFAQARLTPWLLGASAVALASAIAVNPARWQLYPAVIAAVLLAIALRRKRFGRKSAVGCGLLTVLTAALTQLFAMPQLPAPAGPNGVGTITYALERTTRSGERRLFLKVWYPARRPLGEPEGLWSDLAAMADIPWFFRWALAYLGRAPTHSHRGAAYAGGNGPVRVVLYNHSFVSWASETSLLAEELASRGHVVVAIRHLGQVDEYRALDRDALGSSQAAEIRMASEIVARRARDGRLVADRLGQILRSIPGMRNRAPEAYAAMGFSLGGAVSTTLCVEDRRCAAVVNIDGYVPGVDYAGLPVPHYLMIYGDAQPGDDPRPGSQGAYEERIFAQAAHADFHDAAVALPITRWIFGRSTATVAREKRKQADLIADFLSRAGI